jgi:hypothetical protein
MRDIGTLDMRVGFNQTQIANDGSGVISEQGAYRTFQDGNRLIMLAKPKPQVIQQMAAEHQYGNRKQPAQEIKSVQCTAALFSYEQPQPTWQIFVGDKKIDSLPATAKLGQAIVIRDGVSYLAIRPLPTTDVGRDAEVTLEAGQPQMEAYHEAVNVQPALFVNAYFYKKDAPIGADALKQLENAYGGFVVEMGDEAEYGSFEKFRGRGRPPARGDHRPAEERDARAGGGLVSGAAFAAGPGATPRRPRGSRDRQSRLSRAAAGPAAGRSAAASRREDLAAGHARSLAAAGLGPGPARSLNVLVHHEPESSGEGVGEHRAAP